MIITTTPTTEYLNRNYRIVFQPKDAAQYHSRRFAVGAGRLAEYVGASNAAGCFGKAEQMKTDKIRLKFRKMGIVDIYVK